MAKMQYLQAVGFLTETRSYLTMNVAYVAYVATWTVLVLNLSATFYHHSLALPVLLTYAFFTNIDTDILTLCLSDTQIAA